MPAAPLTAGSTYRWLVADDFSTMIGCGFIDKAPGEDGKGRGTGQWSAVLCLRGGGTYRDEHGHEHVVSPGTMLQRFSDVGHGLRLSEPWSECWIAFGVPVEQALLANGVISRRRPVLHVGIDRGFLRELAREQDSLRRAPQEDLPQHLVRLQSLVLSLLSGADRAQADTFDVGRACRHLADDPRADLRQVAGELGLSYERFRKRFQERTGLSPGAWRLQRRLDRARTLLMTGDLAIQDIAHELGYSDAFAFTAQFRRHLGCSPTAFRTRQRGR